MREHWRSNTRQEETRGTEEGNLYCITRSDDDIWGYTICLWNHYFVRTMLRSLLGVSA